MRIINMLLVMLFLTTLLLDTAAATEIKIFKLQHASPYSVARTCESLFGEQGTFVAAPQINALVVNTDDRQLFQEIEKLVAVLDRRPATLRFTVRSQGDSSENSSSFSVHHRRRPGISHDRSSSTRLSERSIIVLEFARASFTDDQVKVYSMPAAYGNEMVVLATSRGLKVSGHVNDNNNVMVQVWYAEDDGDETESLLTELEVEPGQWAEFGGLNQHGSDRSVSGQAGNHGGFKTGKTARQTDRRFSLRVDVLR